MVLIPKIGRRRHESAKDFRPISLIYFVLKVLERLVERFIRNLKEEYPLSTAQHVYLKGRSTETALHEVARSERSFYFLQFTLAAFVDIEEAFNNIITDAIVSSLRSVGVKEPVRNWIACLLTKKEIVVELGGSRITKYVCRGIPHSGVPLPLLWLLTIDEILTDLNSSGTKAVAYVAILVSGPFPNVMSDIIEGALSILNNWVHRWGFGLNPEKTVMLLFTRKYKPLTFQPSRLNS